MDEPPGRFALRPGLTSLGEMALADALLLVEADWDRQLAVGTISDDVIRCYQGDCRSLVKYAAKRFCRVLVRDLAVNDLVVWMGTPKLDGSQVTNNTRRGRLSAAKAFFKTRPRTLLKSRCQASG